MRKIALSIISIAFFSIFSYGQSAVDKEKAEHYIFGTIGVHQYNCYDLNLLAGVGLELDIGKNWKLNYRIDGGNNYFHMPMGLPIGGVVLLVMLSNSNSSNAGVLLLTALIPEGVAYQINLTPSISMSPYVNPFGFDYIGRINCQSSSHKDELDIHFMTSLGGSLNCDIKRFRVAAFSEYRSSWTGLRRGWQSGVKIGYKL